MVTVEVNEYLESHEIICNIIKPDNDAGKQVIVDPFVTCAVDTPDDSFREIGRLMVGKTYEMSNIYKRSDCWMPNKFIEI